MYPQIMRIAIYSAVSVLPIGNIIASNLIID